MVVVGVASDGEAFLCKLYGQRLGLVSGCGFFFGLGVVGWLFFWEGWMVKDVLLGLLCCKTNDGMSIFLLPAIVHTRKEGNLFSFVRME